MATITITVPDSTVARVRTAFGRWDIDAPGTWVDATNAEVKADIEGYIRQKTRRYEERLAQQAALETVTDAL